MEQMGEQSLTAEPIIAPPAKPVTGDGKAAKGPRTGPRWEATAKERVRAGIRRFAKPLSELVSRDANEGDTRLLVTDFLCEALGYDKYADLTTEYQVKGEFADYGVRIDKDLVAFIETKRVSTKLAAKHLRQVQMYAVNEGVEWLILTNGVQWQVYHLTFSQPVAVEQVLEVDLLGDETSSQKMGKLFYLTHESLKRHQITELWKAKQATSPRSLGDIVTSDAVISAVKRELWRARGQRIEREELAKIIRETVLRPECFA